MWKTRKNFYSVESFWCCREFITAILFLAVNQCYGGKCEFMHQFRVPEAYLTLTCKCEGAFEILLEMAIRRSSRGQDLALWTFNQLSELSIPNVKVLEASNGTNTNGSIYLVVKMSNITAEYNDLYACIVKGSGRNDNYVSFEQHLNITFRLEDFLTTKQLISQETYSTQTPLTTSSSSITSGLEPTSTLTRTNISILSSVQKDETSATESPLTVGAIAVSCTLLVVITVFVIVFIVVKVKRRKRAKQTPTDRNEQSMCPAISQNVHPVTHFSSGRISLCAYTQDVHLHDEDQQCSHSSQPSHASLPNHTSEPSQIQWQRTLAIHQSEMQSSQWSPYHPQTLGEMILTHRQPDVSLSTTNQSGSTEGATSTRIVPVANLTSGQEIQERGSNKVTKVQNRGFEKINQLSRESIALCASSHDEHVTVHTESRKSSISDNVSVTMNNNSNENLNVVDTEKRHTFHRRSTSSDSNTSFNNNNSCNAAMLDREKGEKLHGISKVFLVTNNPDDLCAARLNDHDTEVKRLYVENFDRGDDDDAKNNNLTHSVVRNPIHHQYNIRIEDIKADYETRLKLHVSPSSHVCERATVDERPRACCETRNKSAYGRIYSTDNNILV